MIISQDNAINTTTCLVPSQQPTTETETQIPSNNCIACPVWHKVNAFKVWALLVVALLTVLVIIFGCIAFQGDNMNNQSSGKCVLPEYPEHGTYKHDPGLKPGDRFGTLDLTVICLPGYRVLGTQTVFCLNGSWSRPISQCVRFCKLDTHISVQYHCVVNGTIKGSRDCNVYEPSGTVVRPECNSPNYYYPAGNISSMKCINGSWDQVVICALECGRVTSNSVALMIDGRSVEQGEMPWHVGIYHKNTNPYIQICAGSIIANKLVVSAAHCFWNDLEKLRPASEYAVAAGKIYRPWNNPKDVYAQKSDVKEIKIADHFQGGAANFQDDIAVLFLETPFVYHSFVRAICLDFDVEFDNAQLQPGKLGKVAGWGLTAKNGNASQILRVIDLPYVDVKECFEVSEPTFTQYITSDKICAGYRNGTALCKGDSGGGLAFPETQRGKDRFYLRGIVSTAERSRNDDLCNSKTLTTFTKILKHSFFVKKCL